MFMKLVKKLRQAIGWGKTKAYGNVGTLDPKVVAALRGLSEGTTAWYAKAWEIMQYDKGYENGIHGAAITVDLGHSRYMTIQEATGVPWWVVGAIHYKEATCNFAGCLANGQKIIGTGKKTTIIPTGLGPYATWEESAIDVLRRKGWDKYSLASWKDIAQVLYRLERYNGTGYITGAGKTETSPYLWARTNINDGYGKYPADGIWDPTAPSNLTTGAAAIIRELRLMGHTDIPSVSLAGLLES